MMPKHLINPQRCRVLPRQFSWLDQRLIREGHIDRCDPVALALYLFLVTVGDAQGLSYYADANVCRRLSMDPATLACARQTLISAQLLAYQPPLYQVLALDPPANPRQQTGRPLALSELLKMTAAKSTTSNASDQERT